MQLVRPVNPEGAKSVNGLVAIQIEGDQVAYFAGGVDGDERYVGVEK